MEEEEVFDLATINDYELLSNEDGTVLIQDNSVVIKHKESEELKMLPLTDDILQALGLALVLDEDENKADQKDTTQMTMKHEVVEAILPDHILENAEMVLDQPQEMHEERLEESQDEDADSQHNKETITIVFTDDEDPALSKPTAETRNNEEFMDIEDSDKDYEETGGQGNKPTLIWSQDMVSTLLDLYEQNQTRFTNRGRSHRSLWLDIYTKMSLKYPELRQWNEYSLQNKFHRLKKSYKGALMYWKNNYHKSRWVHFEKMHKLMTRQAEIDGSSKGKYKSQYEPKNRTPNAVKMAPIERRATPDGCVGTFLWRKRWTPLMLDKFERLGGGKEPSFWVKLRESMMANEPEVKTVSAAQLQAKMFNLKRAYRFFKQRPMLEPKGDLADKAFFERIARICDSESNENTSNRMRPSYDHKPRAERVYSGPMEKTQKKINQKNYVSRFLDLYQDNYNRFKYSEHPMEIFEEISDIMQKELSGQIHVTPEKLFFKFNDVKNKYEAVMADGSQEAKDSWPLFTKVDSLLRPKPDLWCPSNTKLLIDLYGKVKKTLDDSGPKFWNELSEKFKQSRPGTSVNAAKCESHMKLLLEKFNHLNENLPKEDASRWIYYDKIEQTTTPESEPWSDSDVEVLLSVYKSNMNNSESEDRSKMWEEISAQVSEKLERDVSAVGCKRVMMDLKDKYAKLMKDSVAGASWTFYKSMSEIFPSTLWSKSNVSILLEAYSKNCKRLTSEDPESVWVDIQREVNELSTTAVSHTQCQNEMHVLKARYGAISNSKAGNTTWPFYEKMHQLFSSGSNNSVNNKVEKQQEHNIDNENLPPYEWTEDRINHLLDLYIEKRSDPEITSRRDLFSYIDRELSLTDLSYDVGLVGCSAWIKYGELAHKYIEIKEGKNDDTDWCYYQKLDSILGRRRKRSISTASNDSHDSIADKLHELLETPSKKLKIGDNGETHITDEQDDWNILTAGSTSEKVIKSEPGTAWEDNETLLLLDIYDAHKRRFDTNTNPNSIWMDIHRQVKNKLPSFKKSAQNCEERVKWLKAGYQKIKQGVKVPPAQRLHHYVYKKLDSIFSDNKAWHRSINGNIQNTDLQQNILDEVKKRNHLQSLRNDILKEYCEEKIRLEKEKVEILRRLEEKLSQNGEDSSLRQNLLETLQEVMPENDASI